MQEADPAIIEKRAPLCATAPLLWGLIPLALGITTARMEQWPLCMGAVMPALILFRHRQRGNTVMIICFLSGFLIQWSGNEGIQSDWEELPPREATLTLDIEELFTARKPDRISGIGKILQSNIPHDTISGKRVSFYLKSGASPPMVPIPGQEILCKGVLTYLPHMENEDSFQSYLLSRDIFITLNNGGIIDILSPGKPHQILRRDHYEYFKDSLGAHSRDQESAGNVLASMLLGDRKLLTDQRIELYRISGTYHLFAVSGLHVGCMALFSAGIFRNLRLPASLATLPILMVVWYYVWLTGSSPSSVRAGIMVSCMIASRVLLRQPHVFPALVTSAWIVLIFNPDQLFNLGFQLSYAVVASIILIGLPVSSAIRNSIRTGMVKISRLPRSRRTIIRLKMVMVDITCISISAGIVSMPLIVETFGLFTPGGVAIGIVLNPLASTVILIGCMVMFIAPASPILAGLLATSSWPVIRLIEGILKVGLKVPGAYSNREWILPHAGIILVLLTLLAAWTVQHLRQGENRIPAIFHLVPVLVAVAGLTFGSVDA